jgi:hypothetical protein
MSRSNLGYLQYMNFNDFDILARYLTLTEFLYFHSTCKSLLKGPFDYHDPSAIFIAAFNNCRSNQKALEFVRGHPLVTDLSYNILEDNFFLTEDETFLPRIRKRMEYYEVYGELGTGSSWAWVRYNCVTFSIIKGNLDLALLLMDTKVGPRLCDYFNPEYWACNAGLAGFQDPFFNFLSLACLFGNLAIVEKALCMPNLLVIDEDDPLQYLPGLLESIYNNDIHILKRLLSDDRFKPEMGYGEALDLASTLNRTEMIQVLQPLNVQ